MMHGKNSKSKQNKSKAISKKTRLPNHEVVHFQVVYCGKIRSFEVVPRSVHEPKI